MNHLPLMILILYNLSDSFFGHMSIREGNGWPSDKLSDVLNLSVSLSFT